MKKIAKSVLQFFYKKNWINANNISIMIWKDNTQSHHPYWLLFPIFFLQKIWFNDCLLLNFNRSL